MMLLLENWDIKDSNNEVIQVKGTNKLRYVISDLGATFGKTGGLPLFWTITRSRNNPEDYEKAKFVEGVEGNIVKFRYSGKKKGIFDDITVTQSEMVGRLVIAFEPGTNQRRLPVVLRYCLGRPGCQL